VENYFNYFTEIEEHYQKRRGTGLLLSTLDWALIETWKDAGIPLEAVLSGIDTTFDKYDRRPSKTRKINSLTYCAQEVLAAAEDTKEAAIGAPQPSDTPKATPGLEQEEITGYLRRNAAVLLRIGTPTHVFTPNPSEPAAGGRHNAPTAGAHTSVESSLPDTVRLVAVGCANALEAYTEAYSLMGSPFTSRALEDLERLLTALEEKLLAALVVATPDGELAALRAEADRAIGPYRSKMPGFQIEQLSKQFVHKRLFEKAKIPRLSLFYM
jgi:hypothetical protein